MEATTVRRISLRILTLRTHAARFGSLRQHAFGEIESLLRLRQLPPQLEHVGLERLDRLERVDRVGPRLDLAPTGTMANPAPTRLTTASTAAIRNHVVGLKVMTRSW